MIDLFVPTEGKRPSWMLRRALESVKELMRYRSIYCGPDPPGKKLFDWVDIGPKDGHVIVLDDDDYFIDLPAMLKHTSDADIISSDYMCNRSVINCSLPQIGRYGLRGPRIYSYAMLAQVSIPEQFLGVGYDYALHGTIMKAGGRHVHVPKPCFVYQAATSTHLSKSPRANLLHIEITKYLKRSLNEPS